MAPGMAHCSGELCVQRLHKGRRNAAVARISLVTGTSLAFLAFESIKRRSSNEGGLTMVRTTQIVVLVGLSCLASATRAAADPIAITSGFLTVSRDAPPVSSISIAGTRGFSLEASVTPSEGPVNPLDSCSPCAPGSSVMVGGRLSFSAFSGVATLDGTSYDVSSDVSAPASVHLELFGNPIVAPTDSGFVTSPFTALLFFNRPGTFPDFTDVLDGGGLATMQFVRSSAGGPSLLNLDTVRFDFADQTPVPEPATLLMVAGGLLGIARAARNRRA